jgi:hypothetical protein
MEEKDRTEADRSISRSSVLLELNCKGGISARGQGGTGEFSCDALKLLKGTDSELEGSGWARRQKGRYSGQVWELG